MEEQSFGYWLRLRRKALDLTQEALADHVGCSVGMIRKIESEERRPSAQIVARLAAVFGIPADEQPALLGFARGELRSMPAEAEEHFPWRVAIQSTRTNLPVTVTSFIGREREIAGVRSYLSRPTIRLVTLIGPPGIGKTRLSIEAGRASFDDFPDGIFFVELAPLGDPALIAGTVTEALGYVGARNIPIEQQLKESLRDRKTLIVLDNCEHLIEGVASLTYQLLSACSHLKILATSRESLRIPGEWLYPVQALGVPDDDSLVDMATARSFPALTLFSERACAVRPDFALNTDNLRTVTAICAHLDGLPLVIELIAARMRLMSPESLLAQLTYPFILSVGGMRAASGRQQTLRNAIDWSYRLLSPEEQELFAYLSVFSGGFTLEVLEAMFSRNAAEKPMYQLISLLLDKSLLKLAPTSGVQGEARYAMLATIQEYAREHLKEMGKEAEIRNLHLAYFFEAAHQGDVDMRGPRQVACLHRLAVMRDDLSSALEWAIETGQTETALQMAGSLSWFWNMRSEFSEGRLWLEKVVNLPDAPRHPRLYSNTLAHLALHTWLQSGSNDARPLVEQALSTARAHDNQWNIAWALSILGHVLVDKSDFSGAQSAFEESKALFREVHDRWGYAYILLGQAQIAYIQGDLAGSFALHEEALAAYRQLGDRFFENAVLRLMGTVQVRQGNTTRGLPDLQEALLIAQQLDSKQEIAWVLIAIGDAARTDGNAVRAVHLYLASRNILDSIGVWGQHNEAELEEKLALCRTALSETGFVEAHAQGRAMTMEQAIESSLKTSG
jgi:predicted ATPase/transcriptional regulator with XRE-family HTH domain